MKRLTLILFLLSGCHPSDELSTHDCGPNADWVEAGCRPRVVCSSGTRWEAGACISELKMCGPGTLTSGDSCILPDGGTYQIRVSTTKVSANGYTPVSLLAIGTKPDGMPALDMISWSLSRPGAGTFTPQSQVLTPFGATTSFVPCSAAVDAGCEGPLQFALLRAGQPQTLLASSAVIELMRPADVYSKAACEKGGSVVFFDGMAGDYIHPGMDTITSAIFTGTVTAGAAPDTIRVNVRPADTKQGLWWDLEFSTRMLSMPLRTQVYDGAERAPFAAPNTPGLSITGDGRGCNRSQGRFQIHELSTNGTNLTRLTATFEQSCDGRGLLSGCIHVEK